jgi:eukaryotic-like serine/threonine-protein kinase
MAEQSSQLIGSLAVEKRLVTREQLAEVMAEFNSRRAAGSSVPLGELLVALDYITRHQLEYLLELQGGKKSPSQLIEGYELVKKLGEGGMGGVYLARQLSMDRLVALKVLRKHLSRDADYVERFLREAKLAGRLDHTNIVRAFDVGESGGFHYFAMEYVEGRSLMHFMPESGGLPESFALRLVHQVAQALDYAHQHGVVHRDIKPDNILIDGKGTARLTDLGLAKQAGAGTRLTQTGVMMGTPDYMSPEQARGEGETDIRTDIYSLGATLYHLVTGRPPFEGSSAAVVMTRHLTEPAPWPGDVNPEITANCCRLIQKMMAKRPDDRYATPAALLADLLLVTDGKPPLSAGVDTGRSAIGESGAIQVKPQPVRRARRRRRDTQVQRRPRLASTDPVEAPQDTIAVPLSLAAAAAAGILIVGLLLGGLLYAAVPAVSPPPPAPVSITPAPVSKKASPVKPDVKQTLLRAAPEGGYLIDAEADATVDITREENHGADVMLTLTHDARGPTSEAYLRFDLSAINKPVEKAELHLGAVLVQEGAGVTQQALLVPPGKDKWSEVKINWANKPSVDKVLCSWPLPRGKSTHADVTAAVREALANNRSKLSLCLRLAGSTAGRSKVMYVSREDRTGNAPALLIWPGKGKLVRKPPEVKKHKLAVTIEVKEYEGPEVSKPILHPAGSEGRMRKGAVYVPGSGHTWDTLPAELENKARIVLRTKGQGAKCSLKLSGSHRVFVLTHRAHAKKPDWLGETWEHVEEWKMATKVVAANQRYGYYRVWRSKELLSNKMTLGYDSQLGRPVTYVFVPEELPSYPPAEPEKKD